MRQLTVLNGLLAANVVVLGGLLWTQVAERPLVAAAEAAPSMQQRVPPDPGSTGGVPNAGAQRLAMVNELKAIRAILERQGKALEALGKGVEGGVKVQVVNADELARAMGSGGSRAAAPPPAPILRAAEPAGGSAGGAEPGKE